ncbi:VOC family protein [Nitriliruptor alkaliphilus]|uniref:VOC family protein n=1 Tax=Nitriliruptor alkaliphilus TaxID=427918 RepID=UPI000699040D|nr:VOC family protein [Nitriliruptor alkaliphilus]
MGSPLIPTLRYHDAPAAIEWLVTAFGFEVHQRFDDGDGGVAHAELTFGDGMVMLGSATDSPYGRLVTTVREVGRPTSSPYLMVTDAKAHHDRAVAAGAEIVIELHETDHGSTDYACLDPEGNLWNVGTYDPWQPFE